MPALVAYGKAGFGWFIPISVDDTPWIDPIVPPELREILKYAHKHFCSWVMFDRDGPLLPESFPAFDW